MTHDDLATDLAAHLRGASKRITWEDMQLGPSGTVRPDVYTMEPTYTRMTFEAFECKVSVADIRSDVTSGKWQAYLKFANAVTFATPLGLVNKADVPTTCGLICRSPSGQWRYLKRPTHQVLRVLPWQAWIKLLLDGVERTGYSRRQDHFNEYLARQKLGKKFGDEVAKNLADLQGLPARLEYEVQCHEDNLKRLRLNYEAERERTALQRDQERNRCAGTVGHLAVALGLPAGALLEDLNERAGQLLSLLGSDGGHWRRNGLLELATRMETLAVEVKRAGSLLSAPQVETAEVDL